MACVFLNALLDLLEKEEDVSARPTVIPMGMADLSSIVKKECPTILLQIVADARNLKFGSSEDVKCLNLVEISNIGVELHVFAMQDTTELMEHAFLLLNL